MFSLTFQCILSLESDVCTIRRGGMLCIISMHVCYRVSSSSNNNNKKLKKGGMLFRHLYYFQLTMPTDTPKTG